MRRVLAAVALGTAGIALAACTGSPSKTAHPSVPATTSSASTGVHPSGSPSADSAESRKIGARLADAARRLRGTSFTFLGGSGVTQMQGSFDPVHRRADITGTFGVANGDVRILGTDLYAKGVDPYPESWTHLDTGRLAPGNALTEAIDPTVGASALTMISTVTETSPRHYTGTIDVAALVKRAGSDNRVAAVLRLLGRDPATVTFETALDSSGRFTDLLLSAPATTGSPRTTLSTRYFDYGTAVAVKRPPSSQVREAPANLYTVLAPPASPAPTASPSSSAG